MKLRILHEFNIKHAIRLGGMGIVGGALGGGLIGSAIGALLGDPSSGAKIGSFLGGTVGATAGGALGSQVQNDFKEYRYLLKKIFNGATFIEDPVSIDMSKLKEIVNIIFKNNPDKRECLIINIMQNYKNLFGKRTVSFQNGNVRINGGDEQVASREFNYIPDYTNDRSFQYNYIDKIEGDDLKYLLFFAINDKNADINNDIKQQTSFEKTMIFQKYSILEPTVYKLLNRDDEGKVIITK